jgi:hypothetical protein
MLKLSSPVRRRFETDKRWRRNEYRRVFSIIPPARRIKNFKIDTEKGLLITTSYTGMRGSRVSQRLDLMPFDLGGVVVQRLRDGAAVWQIHQNRALKQVFPFVRLHVGGFSVLISKV